ncbi:MAG: hypothetical protein WCH44_00470, partial [Betaproteobacteria bacterium]
MNIASWESISGSYQLRPGELRSVVGHRPILGPDRLARLLRGQTREQAKRTLTSVFTLCAHAHRGTADLAMAAAAARSSPSPATDPAVMLLVETARDHLRSIALDWPQRLTEHLPGADALDWLRDCPLSLVARTAHTDAASAWALLAQLRAWLETRVLHEPVSHWLQAHGDPDVLARWCSAQAPRLLPARCLAQWQPLAHGLTPTLRSLDLLAADPARQNAQLRELARQWLQESGFAQHPTWMGECAETGPWTRLRD